MLDIISIKPIFGAGAGRWRDGVSAVWMGGCFPFGFGVVPIGMALVALGGGCPSAGWGPLFIA